jgi:hypothetical protein
VQHYVDSKRKVLDEKYLLVGWLAFIAAFYKPKARGPLRKWKQLLWARYNGLAST